MGKKKRISLPLNFLLELLGLSMGDIDPNDLEEKISAVFTHLPGEVVVTISGEQVDVSYDEVSLKKQSEAQRLAERAAKRAGEGNYKQAVSLF